MVKFDHIEVEILQNGSAVPEHDDPATETIPQTITRYLAIKEGQPFVIRLAADREHGFELSNTLGTEVRIDGQYVGGLVSHMTRMPEDNEENVRLIEGLSNLIEGRNVFQRFRFEEADMRFMEPEETLPEVREKFKDQGTVCIKVSECHGYTSPKEDRVDKKEHAPLVVPKNLAKERGSTSRASLTTAEEKDPPGLFIPLEEKTIANFRFKYRTIETLHDLKIVSRLEKDIATLKAELEAIQRERDELKQKVKQEEADELARVPKEKKKRRFLQNLEPGEIELIEERPAQRRKPNADDVVIVLDD